MTRFKWCQSLKTVSEGIVGKTSQERQWERRWDGNTVRCMTLEHGDRRWSTVRDTAVVDKVHAWIVEISTADNESRNGTYPLEGQRMACEVNSRKLVQQGCDGDGSRSS